MTDDLTSITCPLCERGIAFKKKFLDDPKAVSYCRNPDCYYVFYPATGEELSSEDYREHHKAPVRDRTLGIRPERGSFHPSNQPEHLLVPCPGCGRVFHQTKRPSRLASFKCPKCQHLFEMDPRNCVLAPRPYRRHITKGISPDRLYPPMERPPITYVTMDCPDCSAEVKFVEAILETPNHVVLCKSCKTCFDPTDERVVIRRGDTSPSRESTTNLTKVGISQNEIEDFLKK